MQQAYARRRYEVVTLSGPPYSVNVRVDRGSWHGIDLGDLTGRAESLVPARGATIVPLKCAKHKEAEVASNAAARHLARWKLPVKRHGYDLAFAMTDFKLQARALATPSRHAARPTNAPVRRTLRAPFCTGCACSRSLSLCARPPLPPRAL